MEWGKLVSYMFDQFKISFRLSRQPTASKKQINVRLFEINLLATLSLLLIKYMLAWTSSIKCWI